ncbi:hypothetical protein P170DRAFT_510742 [Aspergillus steynii IBT 23096]|uniref:A1 cistron-splicing factor n=1 Tax=Aspergillus steynii IBT 23096 TaxID=1392250 RepID=A0A2I2G595_9EURO|nr:uncharacterized protein P170DRAFT_510742 [Aspergillus steynii IBT 23096]PLB48049.1 hypothetical protein P170DRAFT_510742 [Aspergillus steynii IBT 23096]
MQASLSPTPIILVPHLPPKTLVGIDLITFTSTPNFHGIRDLPPGWHFLYTGTTESLSLRSGAWFYVGDIAAAGAPIDKNALTTRRRDTGPEIHIWRWCTDNETLIPLLGSSDIDKQEAMRYKANLAAVWQSGGLFGYRSRVPPSSMSRGMSGDKTSVPAEVDEENEEEGRRDWQGLTDRLSPGLLSRIIGESEVDVDDRPRWTVTSASTARRDDDDIPGIEKLGEGSGKPEGAVGEQESELSFLPIDLKRTWREGAIGRERTEAAQDRSWALGDLIHQASGTTKDNAGADETVGETQVLGELQFTFLMIMTLMNYSCLQQWKRLLGLILTCRSAIKDRELFMRDVLRLLLLQLKRCDDVEGGLFDLDGEEGGDFLRKLLIKFRKSLYDVVDGAASQVKDEFERLEQWVKEEYDWELDRGVVVRYGILQLEDGEEVEMDTNEGDEDQEMGEYAPVIVDLGDGNTETDKY